MMTPAGLLLSILRFLTAYTATSLAESLKTIVALEPGKYIIIFLARQVCIDIVQGIMFLEEPSSRWYLLEVHLLSTRVRLGKDQLPT